jgi:carbamoylphosphate synthase small subunit
MCALSPHGIATQHTAHSPGQPSGFVVQDLSHEFSHYQAVRSLSDWLKSENIPGIYGVDTRALTRHIRDSKTTVLGKIVVGNEAVEWYDPTKRNMTAEVSIKSPRVFYPADGKYDLHIVAVDLGIKNNILRNLLQRGAKVTLVPWDYDLSKSTLEYDGLFYSNGALVHIAQCRSSVAGAHLS